MTRRGSIGVGHLIVAIAEPHRDTVTSYNEWFEHEHMYAAVLAGPGAFAANRYVATRRLKQLRHPDDGGVFADVDEGSFVALYFLAPGSVAEHFAWSYPQNAWLGANDHNDPNRTLVLTWLCDFVDAVARDARQVPPHVALDHPYRGLVMAWIERGEGVSLADLSRWLTEEHLPELIAGSAIGQALVFEPRDLPDPEGVATTPGAVTANPAVGRQVLVVFFLDADPAEGWSGRFDELADRLAAGGMGELRLVAPFLPTVRGTSQYLDELWDPPSGS